MFRRFVFSWYKISPFAAGILAIVACMGEWDLTEKMVLASTAVLFLHFYEEFGCPGGFPWIGLHVEMGVTDTDSKTWSLNQLNSMVGNWWFGIVVFPITLAFPNAHFLALAVALFAFLEVAMHLIGFNVPFRTLYNPGLGTALFGLMPLSIWYLVQTVPTGLFTWVDIVLALVWIVFNYWLVFRSPLYKHLGKKSDRYAFTEEEVMLAKRYMERAKH
ncbi:MAG: HXXEE domain-containing protein [Coriobacteriales bacterium]|jgi:hypothetical protein